MIALPRTSIAALAFASLASLGSPEGIAAETPAISGHQGCRPGESWDLREAIPEGFREQFKLFLGKKTPAVRGFSEAMALRRLATTPQQKYFAEYWISRSLYGSKLVHISKEGFSVLASRPVFETTIGIQLQALECLAEIHNRFPAIEIPKSVIARIPDYLPVAKNSARLEPLWDVAIIDALSQLSRNQKMSVAEVDRISSWLSGSGAHSALFRGFLAARNSDHSTAIRELNLFLNGSRPHGIRRFADTSEILLARSLYSVGQFEAAITHFKRVTKSSNELANSLQELTWAYLMAERYREAIGTAMNLQAGGLKKTFTPEAPMVMAMAMNEICQYPDSVKAAAIFRKSYERTFKWLESWKNGSRTENLYKLAVQYLRKQGNTPDRIASEWVRSPLFISNQDEINLLFDERDAAARLNRWGSKEQTRIAQSILDHLKDLKPRFHAAKLKLKPGQDLPGKIKQDLLNLKNELIAFRRMQKAAPVWKSVLAHHQRQAPGLERRLAHEIGTDLKLRSLRMHDQLEEIAENIQLVEVEIYNGASEDIIWQNAHPEYKEMAKDLDDDPDRSPASKVWDWGRTRIAGENENVEVWEDELGSFKADLVDNCASKDKYLALGLNRRSPKGSN